MGRTYKKLVRYLRRMNSSLRYISSHPLSKDHVRSAYLRYFTFYFFQLINGNSPRKFTLLENVKYFASIGEAGIVGNIYTGLDDFEEMAFLLHFLKSEDLFIDVGANVGVYSLIASGICRSKSIAIEPIPLTFDKLKANIKLNGLEKLVECQNVGLGPEEAVLNFTILPNSVWNHVAENTGSPGTSQIPVTTLPLDLLLTNGKRPTMIKIDVEGYEMAILKGAKKSLEDEKCKAIIVELNGSGEKYGYKDEQVYLHLISNAFFPFAYEPFTRALKPLNQSALKRNTIFIRDVESVLSRINDAPKRRVLSYWI